MHDSGGNLQAISWAQDDSLPQPRHRSPHCGWCAGSPSPLLSSAPWSDWASGRSCPSWSGAAAGWPSPRWARPPAGSPRCPGTPSPAPSHALHPVIDQELHSPSTAGKTDPEEYWSAVEYSVACRQADCRRINVTQPIIDAFKVVPEDPAEFMEAPLLGRASSLHSHVHVVCRLCTCDPEEDYTIILQDADIHLSHLIVSHGAIGQVLVDLPLQMKATYILSAVAVIHEASASNVIQHPQCRCNRLGGYETRVADLGLTGGSAMITPNFPSTVMSKLRTSIFSHWGSGNACKRSTRLSTSA